MCATFKLSAEESAEIQKIIREISDNFPNRTIIGDFFPKQSIPVIKTNADGLIYDLIKWGFPMRDSKDVIFNVRSETAPEKQFFADSLMQRRCLIPSTGFYEWSHCTKKQKYLFTLPEYQLFLPWRFL